MGSTAAHLLHAKKTDETIKFLLNDDKTKHSSWLATMAFYKALHLIQALFYETNKITFHVEQHTSSHYTTEDVLQKRFTDIHDHYVELYKASRYARYMNFGLTTISDFNSYISHDKVRDQLLNENLRAIVEYTKKQLKEFEDLII